MDNYDRLRQALELADKIGDRVSDLAELIIEINRLYAMESEDGHLGHRRIATWKKTSSGQEYCSHCAAWHTLGSYRQYCSCCGSYMQEE